MKNQLMCWLENGEKKWEMVPESNSKEFMLNLLTNKDVVKHSIFVIPTSGFVSGIWLVPKTHKSGRVDFWNFQEDFGIPYQSVTVKPEARPVLHELNERQSDGTKYGWISPGGQYFHCGYQGHARLASNICFGMYDTDNPERCLEEHGWCKIYKSLLEEEYRVYVNGNYALTEAQFKTLKNMGLENAKDIERMLVKEPGR